MAKILIVDDEPSILLAVKDELEFEGFEVVTAPDGETALEVAERFGPDVVLLDLMLPGMNGYEVCRMLRNKRKDLWIIMLTVRAGEADRVRGLETGADDYVIKPFSLRELVARIHVGLRRTGGTGAAEMRAFGDVEVDTRAHRVTCRGEEVALTAREFDILVYLIEHAGQVVSRDEFLDRVWGAGVYVVPRVVDTHIASLRRKLEERADRPIHLRSIRGVGYRLDLEPTHS